MFVVEVTYGTRKHMPYATVPLRDAAEALCRLAKTQGYTDAKVVTEKEFKQTLQEARGGR